LIVIDVQNDFCSNGALAVADGATVVAPINAMMSGFDFCVLTQDWHPPNHSSFAKNHRGAVPFSLINKDYGPQVLWPAHCVQGTTGAAFHPELNTDAANLILRKGQNPAIDSYSAFFENDKITPTGLVGYLHTQAVTDLVIVGLATDYCVAYSALDGALLGFNVQVDLRACRAIDLDGSLKEALFKMQSAGVGLEDNNG
jgi:nicotinamidase/pyrazinamidase